MKLKTQCTCISMSAICLSKNSSVRKWKKVKIHSFLSQFKFCLQTEFVWNYYQDKQTLKRCYNCLQWESERGACQLSDRVYEVTDWCYKGYGLAGRTWRKDFSDCRKLTTGTFTCLWSTSKDLNLWLFKTINHICCLLCCTVDFAFL